MNGTGGVWVQKPGTGLPDRAKKRPHAPSKCQRPIARRVASPVAAFCRRGRADWGEQQEEHGHEREAPPFPATTRLVGSKVAVGLFRLFSDEKRDTGVVARRTGRPPDLDFSLLLAALSSCSSSSAGAGS